MNHKTFTRHLGNVVMFFEVEANLMQTKNKRRIEKAKDQQSINMNSPNPRSRSSGKGKDEGDNEDIEVLRKEYRNMQANRNAFAHESDLVSKNTEFLTFYLHFRCHRTHRHVPCKSQFYMHYRYCGGSRQLWTSYGQRMKHSRRMWQGYKHVT